MCLHDASFSDADCEYSCSHWPRDSADPSTVISRFIETLTDCHAANEASGIPLEILRYGDGEKSVIELWGEAGECDSLLIWFHGGYWQEGSPIAASPLVAPLVKGGTRVASVGYDYAGEGREVIDVANEAAAAVRLLLSSHPNAGRVVLGGHSAGAQLAYKAAVFVNSPRITGLALLAGVFELAELVDTVIGRPIGLSSTDAMASSCTGDELRGEDIEVLLVVGELDTPRLRTQTAQLYERLRMRGVKARRKEVPGEDHYSLIENLYYTRSEQTSSLVQFCSNDAL